MIKKLVAHLGAYKAASIKTPLFAALEAVMDVLLPTIMAFIIDQGIEKGDMNAIIRYGLLTFLVAAIALVLGVLAGAVCGQRFGLKLGGKLNAVQLRRLVYAYVILSGAVTVVQHL